MHWFPRKAGIRAKLITIFILIKVLPLIALAWLVWQGIQQMGGTLSDNLIDMAGEMRSTAKSVGKLAIDESVTALDRQAQEAIERQTTVTASAVADFLYSIDRDISYIASFKPGESTYHQFVSNRRRALPTHGEWQLNSEGLAWEPRSTLMKSHDQVEAELEDNQKSFNYRPPTSIQQMSSRPLYLEVTFIDLEGNEQIKVTTSDILSRDLKNISKRNNTWLKAERYFEKLAKLEDDQIHVTDVIGGYVSSPVIGTYTPKRAAEKKVPFKPEDAAYAGKENPVGKRFQGLIRWIKPVLQDGQRIGYVTLALDHSHLMAFTDHLVPTAERFSDISDAGSGNYAFMWDYKGRNISHPRDYFIVGYNAETGDPVAPWLDEGTFDRWQASGQSIEQFLKNQPVFSHQSLKIKPALEQIKRGEIALDCRYLNFAPQCAGWWNLTQHGGSGSFVIFWSGIWKLTTAAAIPYYTGQYGSSPRGFGFVTIGANVHEFHLPATEAKQQIDNVISNQDEKLAAQQSNIQNYILTSLEQLTYQLSVSTLVMIAVVVVVGIWMASYLTRRILYFVQGLSLFQAGNLKHRFQADTEDEMGMLAHSFNAMASTIETAMTDLQRQITRRKMFEKKLEESKQNLEKTVEQRTLELKESNLKLAKENEERRKAEERMTFMAQYDDLTGLANRTLFRDHLEMSLAQAHRKSEQVGLLFIDLDKFKEVNDNLGHDIGDALLVRIANIFKASIREGDTAARLGGDEFALITTGIGDSDQLATLAQRILDQVTQPIDIKNHQLEIGCSIGIAVYPDDTESSEELLRHADIAMYQAKDRGGNSFQFFIPEMQAAVEYHKRIEKELLQAIEHGDLFLHYQPKVDIDGKTITGAEALVRWQHPHQGIIPPNDFIPIAERTGLIHPLGEFVLREACRQNRAWQEQGLPPMLMAVNFSPLQLKNQNIVSQVKTILGETGLDPQWLEIELTETTVMHDQAETLETINQLQALGICVSIDDFGTGYSSFERLKQLSFDAIKIDRSFINGIGNANDDAIVKAMIGMAHTLNVKLLAEGVETSDQLNFLKQQGCDQLQGFYYSKPVAADQFVEMLTQRLEGKTIS